MVNGIVGRPCSCFWMHGGC